MRKCRRFLEEVDELGHALETWSDTAAQYCVSVGRKSQILLTGHFATFRLELVSGETYMPLDCVILEGGGNAELSSWKAFGQWVNIIRRVSPKPSFLNTHCTQHEKCSPSYRASHH